jgi:hypothetical protein
MAKGKAQDLFISKAPHFMALFHAGFFGRPRRRGGRVRQFRPPKRRLHRHAGNQANRRRQQGRLRLADVDWPAPPRQRGLLPETRPRHGQRHGELRLYLRRAEGPEKKAIPALKAAKTLDQKVIAFEKAFERAGVKRQSWARIARQAYLDQLVKPQGSPPARKRRRRR